MLTLSQRLGRMETFESLLNNPDDIEDSMLAAVAQTCVEDEELKAAWGVRLATQLSVTLERVIQERLSEALRVVDTRWLRDVQNQAQNAHLAFATSKSNQSLVTSTASKSSVTL